MISRSISRDESHIFFLHSSVENTFKYYIYRIMWKKSVLGLIVSVAGLLVWSCGDGSIDSLGDDELMVISRFPRTIDYDLLDSVVNACKKDKECWERAEKTGEIYKGDYTTILRDSSGNIIYVEGDSAFVWKDGKKLPVFDIPTNNDDDLVVSSTSANKQSASSGNKGSSSGKSEDDEYHVNDDNSSSSVKNGGSSTSRVDRSSNSKIEIQESSVSQSSSSVAPIVLSSSSVKQHNGGGGGGNDGTTCNSGDLSGVCAPTSQIAVKGKPVTYKFTPDKNNKCNATDNILWHVGLGLDQTYGGASPLDQEGGYTFDVTYSLAGEKKSVVFSMGGENLPCASVTVNNECDKDNTYSCKRTLNSTSNNLTKSNPVTYTWEVVKNGCHDVTSISWNGAVSGSSSSVTKDFNAVTNSSNSQVSVTVVDENKSNDVECKPAYVRNEVEKEPTCSIADAIMPTNYAFTVTPSSVEGCDYDDNKCAYSLKKGSSVVASSSSGYDGGALPSISASSAGTVNYTLTLTNGVGTGSCGFSVEYKVPVSRSPNVVENNEFTETYDAGVMYNLSIGSEVRSGFGCKNTGSKTVGTLNGEAISNDWTKIQVRANTSNNIFVVAEDAPANLLCGISY